MNYEIRQQDHIRILSISKGGTKKVIISRNLKNDQMVENMELVKSSKYITLWGQELALQVLEIKENIGGD